MFFSLIKLVKWVIVMLIVCASIVVLCYAAHHQKKNPDDCLAGDDSFMCSGNCSSCEKNSPKKS